MEINSKKAGDECREVPSDRVCHFHSHRLPAKNSFGQLQRDSLSDSGKSFQPNLALLRRDRRVKEREKVGQKEKESLEMKMCETKTGSENLDVSAFCRQKGKE